MAGIGTELAFYNSKGYYGTLADAKLSYYGNNGLSGTLSDRELAFYNSKGYFGSVSDAKLAYYNSRGLSGTLADREAAYYAGALPSLPTDMPIGNVSGFTMVYQEDYLTPFPQGDGTGPGIEDIYVGHKAYDNFQDTSKNGWYDKSNKTIWVANSCLVLNCHWNSVLARPSVAYVVPGGYTHNQQYGKWTWRMNAPAGPNIMEYKIVPLFWPGSNVYGDGEWDFPENGVGSITSIQINLHTATVINAAQGNGTTIPGVKVSDWHIYDVEWTPAYAKFSVDGVVYRTILSTSIAWPVGVMRWGLQAECANQTQGAVPAPTSSGIVYVDWVKQYSYP